MIGPDEIAPPRNRTPCILPRCSAPAVGMKSGSGRYEARCLPHALVSRRAQLKAEQRHVDALEAMNSEQLLLIEEAT